MLNDDVLCDGFLWLLPLFLDEIEYAAWYHQQNEGNACFDALSSVVCEIMLRHLLFLENVITGLRATYITSKLKIYIQFRRNID